MDDPMTLCCTTYGPDEISEVMDCLFRERVTMGEKVAQFERAFAAYIGVDHGIMVNSGSSANLLIFSAATNPPHPMLDPGSEVILPATTWSEPGGWPPTWPARHKARSGCD